MPLLKLTTNAGTAEHPETLLPDLSRRVAALLGKPESYVMVVLETEQVMSFAGTTRPTLYAELKSIGHFTPDQTQKLSAELCATLSKALKVPQDRIYIEFTPSEGHLWGHNGETFGQALRTTDLAEREAVPPGGAKGRRRRLRLRRARRSGIR